MRALLVGILNCKFCACADSRRDFWTTNLKTAVYRGLQVGCHKFATRIRACAEFSIQNPHQKLRMREFSSQICDNQPENLCTVQSMVENKEQTYPARACASKGLCDRS